MVDKLEPSLKQLCKEIIPVADKQMKMLTSSVQIITNKLTENVDAIKMQFTPFEYMVLSETSNLLRDD